jgi:hypothetical protein
MSIVDFYKSLYRVSKGPRYEFWHPDSLLCKTEDKYDTCIWNACHTWEEKTCDSMMKSLGKTPFIWGLRNQTRKKILEGLSPQQANEYSQEVALPYLHGTCPENVESYEFEPLFRSLLELVKCVFGEYQNMPQKEREYEIMLVSNYHWLFPHSSMAIEIRDYLRYEARQKIRELTGEEWGTVFPAVWTTNNSWLPYQISQNFDVCKSY